MLTGLLPGIRDLRAPLAAGYLWLVAFGLILEPHVPERADATGFIASTYRLADGLSVIGVGVASTFAAYVIGSLSKALGTTPLRKLAPTRLEPARAGAWNTLPSASLRALMQSARDARERLADLLALSETNLESELERWVEPSSRPKPQFYSKIQRFSRVTVWQRLVGLVRFRRRSRRVIAALGSSPPSPPEAEQERILFQALVDDLGVVTTTRLLGRDPDLYSAIDRSRAEAEFRLTIIPPLVVTGIVIAWRIGALGGILVAIATLAFAVGLHWDAIRQQRDSNALLVDALSDGRVTSPTLERLEARALERATRSKVDAMRSAASTAANAIARAIEIVEGISSAPSALVAARDAVQEARERFKAVASTFPSAAVDRGTGALDALDGAVGLWSQVMENQQPPGEWHDRVTTLVNDAKAHYEGYRDSVRDELQRLRVQSPGSPETTPPARPREDEGHG